MWVFLPNWFYRWFYRGISFNQIFLAVLCFCVGVGEEGGYEPSRGVMGCNYLTKDLVERRRKVFILE